MRRRMMAEAALWLGIARIALLVIPFRTLASRLGQPLLPAEAATKMAALPKAAGASERARDIGWAVRRTAGNVPFRALCLQQALAANFMLRRRGIPSALHLGVATRKGDEGAMRAHAWLDVAGTRVTGYPVPDEYTEVACFVCAATRHRPTAPVSVTESPAGERCDTLFNQ